MEQSKQFIEEDEIDLRELWKTLLKRKKLILFITAFITITATIYVYFKNIGKITIGPNAINKSKKLIVEEKV